MNQPILPPTPARRRLNLAAVAAVAANLAILLWAAGGCLGPSSFVIRPYLLAPAQHEMTIQWVSDQRQEFTVAYGASPSADRRQPATCRELVYYPDSPRGTSTSGPKRIDYLYQARLTGLAANTLYSYSVRAGGESAGGKFRTMPDKPVPFTFAVYGDSRSNQEGHRQVARAIAAADPAFILHTGDLTSNGGFPLYAPEVFDPLGGVLDHIPLFTAEGNHEAQQLYREIMPMPGNGLWYSFDYANLHVIVLDSTLTDDGDLRKMTAWLEGDLAATKAQWKLVIYHHPSYDIARRHTTWGRRVLTPIFRKHHVDLVLTGHSHSYQRFYPMFTAGQNDGFPITYLVSAGGGAPMAPLLPNNYTAMAEAKLHFVRISIDGAKLTAQAIGADGKAFDSFTIDKTTAGRPDAAYLASAMAEEDFDKYRDLLAGQLARVFLPELPQPGRPATLTFPITAADQPIKLKLYLAPDKGPYAMDQVSVNCPANQTVQVTAIVRATRPAASKGNALDPPVAFECHFTIAGKKEILVGDPLRFGPPTANGLNGKPATRPAFVPGGGE